VRGAEALLAASSVADPGEAIELGRGSGGGRVRAERERAVGAAAAVRESRLANRDPGGDEGFEFEFEASNNNNSG
jgi:hypothetical protein